ncbi:MAG: NlpC/P60 family protein [bacterium]|nr:NlpC/P60 family protein [bacterium]
MAHTRRDVHPTFGYIAVNLAELGERLGSPPMRAHELLKEFERLTIRCHPYDLIRVAHRCMGMRYRRDAARSARPQTFDCSTFVQYVYAHAGLWLPRYAHLMVDYGKVVESPYQPGDLLFTTGKSAWQHPEYPERIGHVAIVTTGGTCMHTDNLDAKRVIEMPIAQLQWPISVAKRLLDNVQECYVAQLPSHLLWVQSSAELEALMRKHLQATYRPRSD